MNNIVLIGFMGVGKSTVARLISKKLGYIALDTDSLIENIENKSIKNIFEADGEKYFRQKEQNIATWLEKSVQNSIISTGGGFHKVGNIKNIGLVIYLQKSFKNIIKDLKDKGQHEVDKRPLLRDLNKAQKIYQDRLEEYETNSHITINIDDLNIDYVIDKICSLKELKS